MLIIKNEDALQRCNEYIEEPFYNKWDEKPSININLEGLAILKY